jgi:hypothetical protein
MQVHDLEDLKQSSQFLPVKRKSKKSERSKEPGYIHLHMRHALTVPDIAVKCIRLL